MSRFTDPLPKEVATAWRKHLGSPGALFGLDWLRQNAAPKVTGATTAELVESGLKLQGYLDALNDIEDRLTEIKQVHQSLDESPLEMPAPR